MNQQPISVLVVDDSEDDAALSLHELKRAGFVVEWKRVHDEPSLRSAIADRDWQVVLLDHSMPELDGWHALAIVRSCAPNSIPVVVSGSIGEDIAVDAIRRGASDYVLKDRLLRLPAAIRRELLLADERRARREAELQVEQMARHDAVTGLPNRSALEEELAICLTNADTIQSGIKVIMLELEHVTAVREAFGHAAGDEFLRLAGRRLLAACPTGTHLSSLGTSEFGLLVRGLDSEATAAVGEALRRALDEPIQLGVVPVQAEVTVGIAAQMQHGEHPSVLLRHACTALQGARRSGLAMATYRDDRATSGSEQLILLGELRGAIESRQLVLEYQPVIDLGSGSFVGVEALVRWNHPTRGRILPGSFMPQAEDCALIHPLAHAILEAAVRWNAAQLAQGRRVNVAVNLAARNLLEPRIVEVIEETLAAAGLPAEQLEIEITEGVLMADPEHARSVLGKLRERGIRLAIDDFGTGYSSFAYLRDLPVHKVKIDRSFVSRLTRSRSDAAIVQGIIDLGHTLGLAIVAEGIEDQLSLDLLGAFGCDLAQGYYIGRPMLSAALDAWEREWNAGIRSGGFGQRWCEMRT